MIETFIGYFLIIFGITAAIYPKAVDRNSQIDKYDNDKELSNTEKITIRIAGLVCIIIGLILIGIFR